MGAMSTDIGIVGLDRGSRTADPMRILLVAPPMLPVPPPTYAGTERVVAALGARGQSRSVRQRTIERRHRVQQRTALTPLLA